MFCCYTVNNVLYTFLVPCSQSEDHRTIPHLMIQCLITVHIHSNDFNISWLISITNEINCLLWMLFSLSHHIRGKIMWIVNTQMLVFHSPDREHQVPRFQYNVDDKQRNSSDITPLQRPKNQLCNWKPSIQLAIVLKQLAKEFFVLSSHAIKTHSHL